MDEFFELLEEAKEKNGFALSDSRLGKRLIDRGTHLDSTKMSVLDCQLLERGRQANMGPGERHYDLAMIVSFLRGISKGTSKNKNSANKAVAVANFAQGNPKGAWSGGKGTKGQGSGFFGKGQNPSGNFNPKGGKNSKGGGKGQAGNFNGKGQNGGQTKTACHYCGGPGHFSANCRARAEDFAKGRRCNICKKPGHRSYGCKMRCVICNQTGHSARAHRDRMNVYHCEVAEDMATPTEAAEVENSNQNGTGDYGDPGTWFSGQANVHICFAAQGTEETTLGYGGLDNCCNTQGVIGALTLFKLKEKYKELGFPEPKTKEKSFPAEYGGIGTQSATEEVTLLLRCGNLLTDAKIDIMPGSDTPLLLGNVTSDKLKLSVLRPGGGRFVIDNGHSSTRSEAIKSNSTQAKNAEHLIHNNIPYQAILPWATDSENWHSGKLWYVNPSGTKTKATLPPFIKPKSK